MTKNSAAKRAVRARQAATGVSYMEAKRQADAKQWLVQLAVQRSTFRQPMPFVADALGETYGNIDNGIAVGLVEHPDSHSLVVGWREIAAADTVERALGMYLVVKDRFTLRWATLTTPVESIGAPASAAARSALWGGDQAPTVDEVGRLARRRLHHRPSLGWDVSFSATVGDEEEPRRWEVDSSAVLSDAVTGEALGMVERFSDDPAAAALTWAMPALADGLVPVVWRNEFEQVPLGQISEIRASSAD